MSTIVELSSSVAVCTTHRRLPVAISNGTPRTILFLCVHNAGRSHLAAGFARHLGGDNIRVYSRGSEPSDRINPAAIAAIAEIGIDIATQTPRNWTDEGIDSTDVVVTMGCGDAYPFLPGVVASTGNSTTPRAMTGNTFDPYETKLSTEPEISLPISLSNLTR
jgi:arsenate reductase